MKIDKSNTPLPAVSMSEGRVSTPPKSGPATSQPASSETSVSLGSTASQLRSMEDGLDSSPPINAAKIAEIKQAISEGRFKMNPEVVADRLIATVRDLIGEKA